MISVYGIISRRNIEYGILPAGKGCHTAVKIPIPAGNVVPDPEQRGLFEFCLYRILPIALELSEEISDKRNSDVLIIIDREDT